jgi:hypothetical protein
MKMIIKKHVVGMFTLLVLAMFGLSSQAQTTNFVVDDFSTNGVGPTNPTNYDYYPTAQIYLNGQITNVWGNWFGAAAALGVSFDPTMDASNNPNSGSLLLTQNWALGNQIIVWQDAGVNNYFGYNPALNGATYTNFECDVRFDPSSPTMVDGTLTNYGNLQFGYRTGGYGQTYFGGANFGIEVPQTNTGWVHVSIPINPVATDIENMLIHIYYGYGSGLTNGTTKFWVDNVKFVGPLIVLNPPPVMGIAPASADLRIFAGDSGSVNSREELVTANSGKSWIGGTYPVSYSFTLSSFPTSIGQTHIFLVPVSSMPGGTLGTYNGVDYTATNGLWLDISPYAGSQVTASVYWKTNLANANPYAAGGNTALRITNSTAIGTWTLTFNNANTGTVTAPGASPVSFTITNGTVATDFANPLYAFFGLEPNVNAGVGQFEDWASISISNVADGSFSEDFTKESTRNVTSSGYWVNFSQVPASIVLIATNDLPAYWVNWDAVGSTGLSLGSKTNILQSGPWIDPRFYAAYGDEAAPFGAPVLLGFENWLVLPKDDLPTANGQPFTPLAPNAFFQVSTNVVSP